MPTRIVNAPNGDIAVIRSEEVLIYDGPSALDFAVNAGAQKIAVNKEAIIESFFDLSSGVAGEVVQKFVNYRLRLAVIGDFEKYTSKALRDWMYECNNGRQLFFAANEDEAIRWLSS